MNLEVRDCVTAWREMTAAAKKGAVRNYVQKLDMSNFIVETPLFSLESLIAYSNYNTEEPMDDAMRAHINPQRGGSQGDYRDGMSNKIDNVIDCLTQFPDSKRAVISISNNALAKHHNDADAKCVRELHLYLDQGAVLNASVFLRAQAASLFPKNIHMIGTIMQRIATALPGRPSLGQLFYVTTLLVADRQ